MREDLKKRVLAGSMAVAVGSAGFASMPGNGMGNEVKAKESENFYKEESVYVKADPSGNVTETTVTEWLKNPEKGNLKDETTLSDIKNVKGEETYSEGADNQIQWNSNGNDIYYQGKSDEKLPVGVKISYQLDGKDITAKELSGKSGKLEIHIEYENDSRKTVKVGEKETQMYTPFTMATAMIFPTDEYKNVEIDNGKIISDGDKNIVVGLGFPGLEENLSLSDTDFDIEIPDSVKITADVENVSVGETFTVASCELMNELNLDEMDSFDDLENSIDELEDAAGKLVDGSSDAKDGADQLKDGAAKLKDGTKALKKGSGELTSGTKSLSDGSKAVAGGIGQLNEKSGSLISGVNSLADGVSKYTAGVSSLQDGSKALYDGAVKVQGGISQADASVKEIVPGAKNLVDGAGAAKESIGSMNNGLKGAADIVNHVADEEITATETVTVTAKATAENVSFMKDSKEIWNSVKSNLPEGLSPGQEDAVRLMVEAAVDQTKSSVRADEVENSVNKTVTAQKKLKDDTEYQKVVTVVNQASNGVSQLNSKMEELVTGTRTLYGGLNQLEQSLAVSGNTESSTIGDGVASLTAGSKALYEGASALVSKNDALNLGTTQLKEGGSQLAKGVSKLSDGSGQVAEGAKTLNSGANALNQGIVSLDEGAGSLYDGTEELADGLKELAEGMSEFKTEGIDEIADALGGDFEKAKDRLEAMSDLSQEYKSYAGIKDGVNGSTKFIIETVGIEE